MYLDFILIKAKKELINKTIVCARFIYNYFLDDKSKNITYHMM